MTLRTEDEQQLMKVIDSINNGVMPNEFQLSEESPDEMGRFLGDRLGTDEVGAWRLNSVATYNEKPYLNSWEDENGSSVSAKYEIVSNSNKVADVEITVTPSGDRGFNFNVSYSKSRRDVEEFLRNNGSSIAFFHKLDTKNEDNQEEQQREPTQPDSEQPMQEEPPQEGISPTQKVILGVTALAIVVLLR